MIGNSKDGWDRNFLNYSSICAEPICWAYGLLRYRLVMPLDPEKFDHCQSKISEIAYRVSIVLVACIFFSSLVLPFAAMILGTASKVLRSIGFALQKNNFTHVRGSAPEKILNQNEVKIMTWNICGIGGGMNYDHGGVIDYRLRLPGIVEKIRSEDPDVLVLQEVYDTALAEALIRELPEYAHYFIHLGANVMGSVGGGMVLSKCAVQSFTNTSFDSNQWSLNRTASILKIKSRPEDQHASACLIGTHLIHDDNNRRKKQFDQILKEIKNEAQIPIVLMGDLNLERDNPDEGGMLAPYLDHGYLGKEPTRTNHMLKQWNKSLSDPGDYIDYISLFKNHPPGVQLVNTHLVKAFSDDFDTKTALSDHHGLVAVLRGLR
jgi:endonuclease/exonuclease/phosphatase family metal-dependent hydrolase